jgi:hypothetical protein
MTETDELLIAALAIACCYVPRPLVASTSAWVLLVILGSQATPRGGSAKAPELEAAIQRALAAP